MITEQGNRFLGISLPSGDPFAVIKSLLDFLHVDYEYPRPRFSNVVDGKGLELIIPGILIKQDKKESILLTSLELESEVYQWLMEEKLKIVRLEV